MNRREYLNIQSPFQFNDLYNAVLEEIDVLHGVIVSLSIRDKQGWNIEIVDTNTFTKLAEFALGCYSTTANICENDIIALSFSGNKVGMRRRILHLLYDIVCRCFASRNSNLFYNFQIRKLQELFCHASGAKYVGYRHVLSDNCTGNAGDSFYRAVYFNLFEQVIVSCRNNIFENILELFKVYGRCELQSDTDDFDELLLTLKLAAGMYLNNCLC